MFSLLPIETPNIIYLELEDINCLLPYHLSLFSSELKSEDYEFIANLKIPFLRGPVDSPEQTAENSFKTHQFSNHGIIKFYSELVQVPSKYRKELWREILADLRDYYDVVVIGSGLGG